MSLSLTRTRRRPGVVAAVVHRVSGLALTLFLPAHFITLGTALRGAAPLERFLQLTASPAVRLLEAGLVVSLAVHLACGLRVLAIEFLALRDRTAATVATCFGFALACGLVYLLSVPIAGAGG